MPSIATPRAGRSDAVDNSNKSAKKINEAAKRANQPMAAAGAVPAYHQVQPNVQPGSIAANLSLRASNMCEASSNLANVLARLGMYEVTPNVAQAICSTENVLDVLDNHVDVEVRSVETFLKTAIHGNEEKEAEDECDQEEVEGGIAGTKYGRSFYYAADIVKNRLRNIDRMLERLRTSLMGERPTAEAKTASNDSTTSLHQCASVLIDRMDATAMRVNDLANEIRGSLLGE